MTRTSSIVPRCRCFSECPAVTLAMGKGASQRCQQPLKSNQLNNLTLINNIHNFCRLEDLKMPRSATVKKRKNPTAFGEVPLLPSSKKPCTGDISTTKAIRKLATKPSKTAAVLSNGAAKGQRRALSVIPSRPICIHDVYNVTNLYVFQAFNLRGVTEQVHKHSKTLMQRNVVHRLEYLKEIVQQDKDAEKYSDERCIRKTNRTIQETLDYLVYYMKEEARESDDNKESYLDIYTAGLAMFLALLEASEHFRVVVFQNGWSVLVELLCRHNALMRYHVCSIMKACFVNKGQADPDNPNQLTASDRSWNDRVALQIAKTATWPIIFTDKTEHWGLKATRVSMELMVDFCYALSRTRESRRRHVELVTGVLLGRSTLFRERANDLIAQVLAMQGPFDALAEERKQLGKDIQRAKALFKAFVASGSKDATILVKLRTEWTSLEARHLANAARLDEYKAAYAKLQ
jgi:hypothetical protein